VKPAGGGEGVELGSDADLGRLSPLGAGTLVVSPHLDDAVLSCGRLLDAQPRSAVLTVFAGSPSDRAVLTDWDRLCGFHEGDDVVALRRAEDRAALAALGASPIWLSYAEPDQLPYAPERVADVVGLLARAIEALSPRMVVLPLGIRHPHHLLVHDLAVAAVRAEPGPLVAVFQEMPYEALYPDEARSRVDEARRLGTLGEPMDLGVGSRRAKLRAVSRYPTQLRGLGRRTRRRVTLRPERYWRAQLD